MSTVVLCRSAARSAVTATIGVDVTGAEPGRTTTRYWPSAAAKISGASRAGRRWRQVASSWSMARSLREGS